MDQDEVAATVAESKECFVTLFSNARERKSWKLNDKQRATFKEVLECYELLKSLQDRGLSPYKVIPEKLKQVREEIAEREEAEAEKREAAVEKKRKAQARARSRRLAKNMTAGIEPSQMPGAGGTWFKVTVRNKNKSPVEDVNVKVTGTLASGKKVSKTLWIERIGAGKRSKRTFKWKAVTNPRCKVTKVGR